MNSGISVSGIFILITILIVILAFTPWIFKKRGKIPSVQQRETDLRLTYKRFMQLYPYSNITYQDYKQMQAQYAYKKAVSSMKIKRMVRQTFAQSIFINNVPKTMMSSRRKRNMLTTDCAADIAMFSSNSIIKLLTCIHLL